MRYTISDDEFLKLLAEYGTIPAAAASLYSSWNDYNDGRARMLKQAKRLANQGLIERVGKARHGAGAWCVVWRVVE